MPGLAKPEISFFPLWHIRVLGCRLHRAAPGWRTRMAGTDDEALLHLLLGTEPPA